MVGQKGSDEMMVENLIADPADRHRSDELLAEAFGLTGQGRAAEPDHRPVVTTTVAERGPAAT